MSKGGKNKAIRRMNTIVFMCSLLILSTRRRRVSDPSCSHLREHAVETRTIEPCAMSLDSPRSKVIKFSFFISVGRGCVFAVFFGPVPEEAFWTS